MSDSAGIIYADRAYGTLNTPPAFLESVVCRITTAGIDDVK
jgi:hypothetical protein